MENYLRCGEKLKSNQFLEFDYKWPPILCPGALINQGMETKTRALLNAIVVFAEDSHFGLVARHNCNVRHGTSFYFIASFFTSVDAVTVFFFLFCM
jgi:hypothetical protein